MPYSSDFGVALRRLGTSDHWLDKILPRGRSIVPPSILPVPNPISVSQSVWRGKTQSPKTANAFRQVDVHPLMASTLKAFIGNRETGFVFQSASGKPLTQRNVLRDGFEKIRKDLQLTQSGLGFHAFRRFRTAHLRKHRVPWDLEKFWIGHANKTVSDKYAEQLKEDVEWRKTEARRIGLGFSLSAKALIGQLGQPDAKISRRKKAA